MSVWKSVKRRLHPKLFSYLVSVILPLVLLPLALSPNKDSKCGFVMLLIGGYWLFEPIPIAMTALLPVFLFPILGVVSSQQICENYMKETFLMFIGGLIMAIAVEDSRLHERIAMKILLLIGSGIHWLMLGFMITTMVLSMWISNTATTAMQVPIVEALLAKICPDQDGEGIPLEDSKENNKDTGDSASLTESKQYPEEDTKPPKKITKGSSTIRTALLLSVCYSANIGGTGTLTGTGPNMALKGLMENLHPDSDEITFATWMMYNVPSMIICVLIGWIYLWLVYIKCSKKNYNIESKESIREIISERYKKLGPISTHEASVIVLFFLLVFLWVFRDPKFIPGWAEAMDVGVKIGDSAPAIFVCFWLFLLPSNFKNWNSRPILEWKTVQAKLPWGVIILLGGGFALADGAQKSGLSETLGSKLSSLDVLPLGAIVAVLCLATAMITEIVSNTTAATILLPVFSQMALSMGVNPLYLMLPVTVVCSYAFMLPVATPPNAIAFESGNMKTIDMAKPGLVMNLVCCGVQLFMINTLGVAMFDLNSFPTWAHHNQNASTFEAQLNKSFDGILPTQINGTLLI